MILGTIASSSDEAILSDLFRNTQGPTDRQIVELHQAGRRRLRFSFFADEHAPGAAPVLHAVNADASHGASRR
jgi:hypothetical protein